MGRDGRRGEPPQCRTKTDGCGGCRRASSIGGRFWGDEPADAIEWDRAGGAEEKPRGALLKAGGVDDQKRRMNADGCKRIDAFDPFFFTESEGDHAVRELRAVLARARGRHNGQILQRPTPSPTGWQCTTKPVARLGGMRSRSRLGRWQRETGAEDHRQARRAGKKVSEVASRVSVGTDGAGWSQVVDVRSMKLAAKVCKAVKRPARNQRRGCAPALES